MDENIGSVDKTLRLVAGVLLLLSGFGLKHLWLGGIGMVLIVTGLASRCPLYLPFHFSTYKS